MLTFDNTFPVQIPTLEDVANSELPDIMEVGETSEYWLYIKRSTRKMELVSKVSGETFATCDPDEAGMYGIGTAQIAAAKSCLKM